MHVISRAIDGKFFNVNKDELSRYAAELFRRIRDVYHCELYAFELMGNHIHWLVLNGCERFDLVQQYITSKIAQRINKLRGTRGAVFERPAATRVMKNWGETCDVVRYILRNATAQKIAVLPSDYPYSSTNKTFRDIAQMNVPPEFYDDLWIMDGVSKDRMSQKTLEALQKLRKLKEIIKLVDGQINKQSA